MITLNTDAEVRDWCLFASAGMHRHNGEEQAADYADRMMAERNKRIAKPVPQDKTATTDKSKWRCETCKHAICTGTCPSTFVPIWCNIHRFSHGLENWGCSDWEQKP